MHESTDERELVHSARGGDGQAFDELVRRHQQVAFRAAYLVLRDAQAAEDVAQDAFVRAYRGLGGFREGEPFRPWLLRIVSNLALNEVRSAGRRRGLLERFGFAAPSTEPAADRALVGGETRAEVWDAVNALPPDDRTVLYLRFFLELPEKEIAAVIGKAPGTVKSRLNRASGRLRAVIDARYPGLRPGAWQEAADE
ncbi:MAG: RNA polymerase [Anaerolinea sp.]|nr:RNA polymerase [Anaerolinea sp.]